MCIRDRDSKIAKYRSLIQILRDKISELEKHEVEIRKETYERLKENEEKHRVAVAEEFEKLKILEEAKKLEISEKSELISRIDHFSSMIEAQVRVLIEEKTEEIRNLESKAVPFELKETSLFGIPFYIAIFESPKRVRAEIYPPVVAKSYTGVLQRIKRMFFSFSLESRMELLFDQRFPELNREVFMNLENRMRSNISFRKRIFERGKSSNLLDSSEFISSIAGGIRKLEREGWISRDEGQKIMKIYVES